MPDAVSTAAASLAGAARVRKVHDQSHWDGAVSELGGSLLQSWRWGEFKARHGWRPHRLLGEQDGKAIAAAQVLSRPVGPLSVLYVPRGPAVGRAEPGGLAALTLAMDELGRSSRAAIAFVEPDNEQAAGLPLQGGLGWTVSETELQPLRTIKVPIDHDDDAILGGMKSKCRYNIRLASRRGVTVRQGSIQEIVDFYELLEETSQRDAFGIHSVEYYADMLDVFGASSALLIAEYAGEMAAGAIVLQHGDEAIYMFGASSRAHQRHMPTHLLQFEAMRWARERGCRWYDLWGIPPTDTPPDEAEDGRMNIRSGLWGVYRFKQGFGGEIIGYPGVFERPYYPTLINLWRRFRPGPGA